MDSPRLELRDVSKRFGTQLVLEDVSLEIGVGEVRGLVGQNGSGKSTLVKILSGYHEPEPGATIVVDGVPLKLPTTSERVRKAGIRHVHQDLGLVGELSVLDNIRVGRYVTGAFKRIRWRDERVVATAALQKLGVDVPLDTPVHLLPQSVRALIAIARAIQEKPDEPASLLVLDEATASLQAGEVEEVFSAIRSWTAHGGSVIYVSHRLDEVLTVANDVTVIRDGRVVETFANDGVTESDLVTKIVGFDLGSVYPSPPASRGKQLLTVAHVAADHIVDTGLTLHEGEILGVTGLPGAGFDELPYVIMGLEPDTSGTVTVGDTVLEAGHYTVRDAVRAGLALVPADRHRHGVALSLSVRENATLPSISRFARGGRMNRGAELDFLQEMIDDYGIVTAHSEQPIQQLSGGNQQKVALGKWLLGGTRVLMLHEPTQGVDPRSRRDIFQRVADAVEAGLGVLMFSVEYEDLAQLCNRVLVFQRGSIVWELDREHLSKQAIVDRCYRKKSIHAEPEPEPVRSRA